MSKDKTKKSRIVANNLYILKLSWKISPMRVISDFIFNGIYYFMWVFYSVVFVKYLLGAIQAEKSFGSLVLFILGTVVVMGTSQFFNEWYNNRLKPMTDNIINSKLNQILFDKAAEVELACYEDTEFYNTYTLAMKEADTRVASVLSSASGIAFGVIAAVFVLFAMYSIDQYVIIFLISPLLANFLFGTIANKVVYNRDVDSTAHRRKQDYVNRVVYLQAFAKEIRLSNIFKVLTGTYEKGYTGVLKVIDKYKGKSIRAWILYNIFGFIVIFEGVLLYGSYRAIVSKTITLADFAVLASAMVSASWILITLSRNVITAFQNGLYIENLVKFLEYIPEFSENQPGLIPSRKIESIEFKNVSFTYKGQTEPVIKDLNFRVNGLEKIAMVGHNGAGKTTIIKLLMRLYDPTAGEIFLNNVNIKDYNVKEYRKLFGTAFQDYQIFSMTVSENVLMRESNIEADTENVKEALRKSGAYDKIMSLNKTTETILTREFDEEGAVLSGGEAQKVAVARAFAKDYDIAVFDEPSSALDPIAEYKLYESMMETCGTKTVIFISHRLSSAILADKVYLLENGTIAEEGTHKELMNLNGKYAEMFTKQAEQYVEDNYSLLENA